MKLDNPICQECWGNWVKAQCKREVEGFDRCEDYIERCTKCLQDFSQDGAKNKLCLLIIYKLKMVVVLPYIAVVVAFLGWVLPAFVTFIPRIEVSLLHRLRLKKLFLASFGLTLSIFVLVVNQSGSSVTNVVLVIFFVVLSLIRLPELVFPALDTSPTYKEGRYRPV